jgi:hypothetical protein
MTRDEVMQRMSASEYLHWRILERIEPFGEVGHYFRSGQLLSMIANMFQEEGTPAYVASDFMPQFEDPVVKTPEQMGAVLTMMQQMQEAIHNGG